MRKYLAYYENEWPANIAELTAVENKPFVGYLKGEGVSFTVIPEPVVGPADNEIWYTTVDGEVSEYRLMHESLGSFTNNCNTVVISNTYTDKGIITFQDPVTYIAGNLGSYDGGFFSGNIQHIILPTGLQSIGDVFCGCMSASQAGQYPSLTSITIPNSVTSIGSSAFAYSSLTSITFKGTKEQWNAISKASDWNSGCPEITVHCTDGDVIIPAAE